MPILDEHTLDFISHSAEQTRRFGARLGALLQAGDLICLEGDLGTGKTCLAQGVGQGMGIVESITSPSFTLVAEHRPPPPAPVLYHIDLYRLDAPVAEALAFGLDDYLLGDGVCLIEWADRICSALPRGRLWITLRHLDRSKRGIIVTASSHRYDDLLHQFRKTAFGV
jgi:tRNA threonylcarbamoyladenosine biosynthesis protein TsaE